MKNEKTSVRQYYGMIAMSAGSCCGPACGCSTDAKQDDSWDMLAEYASADKDITEVANLGLGCGTPLAYANVQPGMVVVDLGSGAGLDSFLAARVVGPTGSVIGVDMTPAMIQRARQNAVRLRITNVNFRLGDIEELPIDSGTVDRIVSNCVINLAPEKHKVFAEMYRVLKPGGMFAVSDIVSTEPLPDDVRADMRLWASCVAGALEKEEYLSTIRSAGFVEVKVNAVKSYPVDAQARCELQSVTVTAQRPQQ
jgi:arsenite methyltransferase